MSTNKTYDIVLYGATGFTGKLVINYIKDQLSRNGANLRFAIAGRNEKRLEEAKVAGGWPANKPLDILIADTADLASIAAMAKSARCIIDTAGPFELYGEPVVRACIEHGAHYLDITGEPGYVTKLIDEYDKVARVKNVAIIPSCGFDSIPTDLVTFLAVSKLSPEEIADSKVTVSCYTQWKNPILSHGTMRTAVEGMGGMGSPSRVRQAFPFPHYVSRLADYALPVPTSDVVVIDRTRQILSDASINHKAAKVAQYPKVLHSSVYLCYGNLFTMVKLIVVLILLVLTVRLVPFGKKFVLSKLPPGGGPTPAQRAQVSFKTTALVDIVNPKTKNKATRSFKCSLSGGDGGYTQTAMFITECALMLVSEIDQVPIAKAGGVLTPSSAFGFKLVEKLKQFVGIGISDSE